jgi:PPOX class probable F420-dependent enzyme
VTDLVRARFAAARVARLATLGAGEQPHVVPVVFALVGDEVVTAVDRKAKATRSLRRLANVRAHPRVSLLVDHYDEDWSTLWWVRADGSARVLAAGSDDERDGIRALVGKYPQYVQDPPPGPVVAVRIDTWRDWSA